MGIDRQQLRMRSVVSTVLSVFLLVGLIGPRAQASGPAPIVEAGVCDAVAIGRPSPGETQVFHIDDFLQQAPPSKIRGNFKLTLEAIFQLIDNYYGPLLAKWKKLVGFDWEAVQRDLRHKAESIKSVPEMYYLVSDFLFKYFNDAHVSVSHPSTLVWRLPLQLYSVNSELYVTYVAGSLYPAGVRQPKLQDKLVQINGQSVDDFQKMFPKWNSAGNTLTDRKLFGFGFGGWSEASGLPLLREDIAKMQGLDLQFQTPGGETYAVHLPFTKTGTGLDNVSHGNGESSPQVRHMRLNRHHERPSFIVAHAPHTEGLIKSFHNLFRAEVVRPLLKDDVQADPKAVGRKLNLGETLPEFALPKDFKKLTLPEDVTNHPQLAALIDADFFLAGTYTKNGRTVGYLRIKDYEPDDLMTMLTALRYIIGTLEKQTDYLVIDQTNNPGGEVVMSDFVIKSLVGQYDLGKSMRYSVKPNGDFSRQFLELREQIAANEDGLLTPAQVQSFVERIDTEYAKIKNAQDTGQDLSDPISMVMMSEYFQMAIDAQLKEILSTKVQPKVTMEMVMNELLGVDISTDQVYTKPVAFVINETCFSGGDQTPAQAQDYGRAMIVGLGADRTAGAGGTVVEHEIHQTGIFGTIIRLTESLMVRPDKRLIENIGVHADLVVPLVPNDVGDQFTNVFDRLATAIDQAFAPNLK